MPKQLLIYESAIPVSHARHGAASVEPSDSYAFTAGVNAVPLMAVTAGLRELTEETGYTGFYCRVLQTGELAAGQEVMVTDRPFPDWTILRANRILYAESPSPDDLQALRSLTLLSGEWKRITGRMLRRVAE